MVLPRPACLRASAQGLTRSALRRGAYGARSSPFRQAGRRTYASGHEAKQSSDLPWMIGAVVFTVPAATWLLGQAPAKQPHGAHGHGEEHEKSADEAPQEEENKDDSAADEKSEKSKDEPDQDSQDGAKDDADGKADNKHKAEDKKDDKSADKSDDKAEKGGDSASEDKESDGSSERGKGDRPPTETKGEKDAQSNTSGAKHPNLDDAEKSKKANGPTATAKTQGTVKPTNRPDNSPEEKKDDSEGKKKEDSKGKKESGEKQEDGKEE